MQTIEDIQDKNIYDFLKNGTAFDGYLYAMGILIDSFIKSGMSTFCNKPYDLKNINIFTMSSDELANILISCVLSSSTDTRNNFIKNILTDSQSKYVV